MTPEAKIWSILKNINDALAIAPSGEPVFVDIKDIGKWVKREDQEQIFQKLSKDEKLFEIKEKPDYKKSFRYALLIANPDELHRALNEAHIKHFRSLEMLGGENLFAVIDVAADIMEELQFVTTSRVTIPLIRPLVRFTALMPADGINFRDKYCDYRWKAIKYLKDNDHIENYHLNNEAFHRWRFTITIDLDRTKFTNFYEKLLKVYKKRVKFSDKATEQKTAATIPEPPTQKIEIVKGKMEVEGLAKGLEAIATKNEDTTITKNKRVIRLPHFQSTPWHDVTFRFLDERNVLMQGGVKTATADYEALGFSDDKSKKPNLAWTFLFGMAKNNGETKEIPSPIPDNIKQIKRQISDFFKKLFKNDTEPFYDFSETNTYKLKIKLIPPQTEEAPAEDRFGLKSYLDETMTSEYETPKSDDEW
jgi:hypothetical protein